MRSTARWHESSRLDDVLRIAVLRGGGLGDLIFALPAVDALAAAYPEAEIVLLGTPLHQALLTGRPGPISRVEVLPSVEGVHGGGHDEIATARFVRRMRAERFDLACQLHGGGRHSNPFLKTLEARHTVGTATADADPLERTLPYVYYQHEALRWLETVGLVGAVPLDTEPHLTVLPEEGSAAEALATGGAAAGAGRRTVVIHPGATDPRRRWPAARFGEVAGRLSAAGARVLVVGDDSDAQAAAEVVATAASSSVRSLAGKLDLSQLTGLCSVADVFLGNDSGPRHLAQAVGTPTVGIYWVGNLINGGPLTRALNRVQLSWTTRCPVCGRDCTQVGWTSERCDHDDSFVTDVSADAVHSDVAELMATRAPLRG